MKAKKLLVITIVLSTGLLFAASLWPTKRAVNGANHNALSGPSGKFGPTIETVLPAARTEVAIDKLDILDLETGREFLQPPLKTFDQPVDGIMTWIRSNGLDISCSVWSAGAACVTYNMTLVPDDGKSWEETTEEKLLSHPALSPGRHSPRRLLVLGPDRPDTFMFRTVEGTLGMLQIVGLSQNGKGVNIRYKLINPVRSENSIALR